VTCVVVAFSIYGPRRRGEDEMMIRRQSYREQQELKRNAMLATGLIADRFPGVSRIAFRLTYYQRTVDPVLMTRVVSFIPADCAYFRLGCMREGCTNGGFDLAPVVAGMVKSSRTSGKGRIVCRGKSENAGPVHASLAYEVSIEYGGPAKK
jgi:hypothetical protein